MPQNIKINSVRSLRFKCIYDEYYDFMLYRGECSDDSDWDACLVANIDADGVLTPKRYDNQGQPTTHGGEVYSKMVWSGAVCNDVTLKDIGLTGTDNGFIAYAKDRITNQTFMDMLTGTTYSLDDARFFMSPVSGNTQMYTYPMTIESDSKGKYFSMKGGFYQGFFKLNGFDYQTLPSYIENDWCLNFVLRKRDDYTDTPGTLNSLYPENKGIFFYMGTRAENKFWEMYNSDEDKKEFLRPDALTDGYFACEYVDEDNKSVLDGGKYLDSCDGETAWDTSYVEDEENITEATAGTTDGKELDVKGYYEIKTDNKFIFFNRTCTGFTVNTWDSSENDYEYDDCNDVITPTSDHKNVVALTGITDDCKENKFITYNRTYTGKTVNNTEEEIRYTKYDVYKDIKNNAFALRIDNEGRIGYKFATCDEESESIGFKEEYTKKSIIPNNKWVDVTVRFKILNGTSEQCSKHIGQRSMKIYIYVDGYLVFVSKELPEFNFRRLNDINQKQEGVPYNISLGGGTQGLLETISKDYYDVSKYALPLEKGFAGSFMGDIRSFRFYDCFNGVQAIRNHINL